MSTDDINELNGLIQISELIDTNINSAFNTYARFFGKPTRFKSSNKMTALNLFTERLKNYIDANDLEVLSNYAAIYAMEPGFGEEYDKVSKHIYHCIEKQYN